MPVPAAPIIPLDVDHGTVFVQAIEPGIPPGLPAGAIYPIFGARLSPYEWTLGIVPGVVPHPGAAPVYFGTITLDALMTLGGGNLPRTQPPKGSGQFWNDGNLVCVA